MKIGVRARRPWLPFFHADFFAIANSWTDAQGMACLRLISSYWENSRLPNDDAKLARIARMSPKQWAKASPVIKEFFGENWISERLDLELAKAVEISNKRKDAALQKHRKSRTIAGQAQEQEQSHLHLQSSGMVWGTRAREESLSEEVEALCLAFKTACGIRREKDVPQDWGDVHARAARWLAIGYSTIMIVSEARAVVARTGMIKPLNYFEEAFATATRQAARPLPVAGASDAQRF